MSNVVFTCFVPGTAKPQGSARAFMPKGGKFPVVTSANPKLKPWRAAMTAAFHYKRHQLKHTTFAAPCKIDAVFFMPQNGASIREKRIWTAVKPDLDKLQRALCDSLKDAGVYVDDSQVCMIKCVKRYSALDKVPGVYVVVKELPSAAEAIANLMEKEFSATPVSPRSIESEPEGGVTGQ